MNRNNCDNGIGNFHHNLWWCKNCEDKEECIKILWESNKCPTCLGSGKLQDRVHDWITPDCYMCDGTGKRPKFYEKLYGKLS